MQQNIDKNEGETHRGTSKKRRIVKEFFHEKNSELDYTEREIKQEMSSCKISSLTIILFDDIDVVFEEDEGLWNTIKGFLKISKKPVIFTVSRNLAYVKANLCEDTQVLTLKPASQDIAVEKVKYQCVKHNRRNAAIDLQLLTSHNANDLRRSLLDAQFWTQEKEASCSYQGSCSYMLKTSEVPLYKRVHANSFFLGSLNFLTCDLKQLLLNDAPSHSMSVISEYHKMGYDVLHSNIFSVMNVIDNLKTELLWQNIRYCSDRETANSASESNMWDEACKLFELKKTALLKGSSSKDLFAFSSLLEDFSFADSLKGQFYTNFHWLSIPERVKKWTDGLPICSESNFHSYGDILADIIGLMNIYKIREMCSNYPETYAPTEKSIQLFLDHPLLKCDYIFNNKTE
ncbi:ATPase family AAA domain-containing protein 5, partial [Stegodyphus mimosarum]